MRAQGDFDKSYYDRFYRNPETRAASKTDAERCADYVGAHLKHLEIPVKRVLDVGCGLGHMLRRMKTPFPAARCDGVEYSPYLCEKYGWTQGSVLDHKVSSPYHLVICNDVLQYLNDADATIAMQKLASFTHYALFFSALTAEDWDEVADRERTDERVYMRPVTWYRRRLRRNFWALGGGLYLRKDSGYLLWHLDRL